MTRCGKVTIGCGPCIYDDDGCLIAATQAHELKTVKDSFLKKKLGLPESPELMEAINEVLATYGKSNRHKFRAPVYYMLTVMFGKEDIYGMEAALEADLGKIKARF